MANFNPTKEQEAALELFKKGRSMALEARAGTGKTSTLMLLAENARSSAVQYLAFNKSIVTDASQRFPQHVRCSTAHSLAYRAVGRDYYHRLNGQRMRSDEIARMLGVQDLVVDVGGKSKRLRAGFLASHAMRGISLFCQTADMLPAGAHLPYVEGIDEPDGEGGRTWKNNLLVREVLASTMKKAWMDISSLRGSLPFGHEHYLKLWQLQEPLIEADVILFDEAQDASPVMQAIVLGQGDAQKVWTGDSEQAIYEWNGAVNALAQIPADARAYLTQSFRFGEDIAGVANEVLGMLCVEPLVQGLASKGGIVERRPTKHVVLPLTILCRTNAGALVNLMAVQEAGGHPHLVGGGSEMLSFARAAQDLQAGKHTQHHDLACFESWGEVVEYVQEDAQGGDLRLSVGLVEAFGVRKLEQALARMPLEGAADVIVSTAHKAKGREWPNVRLGSDFPTGKDKRGEPCVVLDEELRLLYVAVTRAKEWLDISNVELLKKGDNDEQA